ncbi:MAG: L-sorbosone dehydrogenase, partial [Planctomycetota bacterium]|nr:L-sorbosone dehydrogenase [Planctomycetota bacterium]
LGPDLTKVSEKYKGQALLEQILDPSEEINEKFQTWMFLTKNGEMITGVIQSEARGTIRVIPNLLNPKAVIPVRKKQIAQRKASKVSSMPAGLLNTLRKEEILDLLAFLEAGGYEVPDGLKEN